ncbi:unnamed protein product [Gongylonema pulchrum]|uniref:Protein kinase domain-containing protein n=1 Tax=Gongylonema pulchrum TaxID=637853 RepID=A0A183D7V0_9BILA|nr:unnamed protein product [Gongylonema pulchrum]
MPSNFEQLEPCSSNGDDSSENLPDLLYDSRKRCHYASTAFLGKGGFASCFAACEKPSSLKVALKIIRKSRLTREAQWEKIRKEIIIHQSLNHPNVLKFYNYFEDTINICMLLTLVQNLDIRLKDAYY